MSMNIAVTGASTGIGKALVRKFSSEGHNVIAISRNKKALEDNFNDFQNVEIYAIDFLDINEIENFANILKNKNIDILINNAGGGYGNSYIENDFQQNWINSYMVNVVAPMRLSKSVIPNMRNNKFGHIFFITSLIVDRPQPGLGNYQSAKYAEMMLAKTLKTELYEQNIKITDIVPGSIDTTPGYAKPNSLSAEEVADAVYWVSELPKHFNVGVMHLTHVNGMQA